MEKENKELIQKIKTISRNGFHNIEEINNEAIDFLTQNIKSADKELVEKIYLKLCKPKERATIVINNNDYNKPKIIKGLFEKAKTST